MRWARDEADLVRLQFALAELATKEPQWQSRDKAPVIGGVFAATRTRHPKGGAEGEDVWSAAVVMRAGRVLDHAVVRGRAGAPYRPGFLALVWGPLLEETVQALSRPPDVLLLDATGRDHPRRGGLALHLGAVLNVPTIGVTDRTLVAVAEDPEPDRGDACPFLIDGRVVGHVVRTRARVRPVCVHAGWRTDPDQARALVLAVTGARSRTPEPLRRARHLVRTRRAIDEGRSPSGGSTEGELTGIRFGSAGPPR
jgi:deoxyribonuclease V